MERTGASELFGVRETVSGGCENTQAIYGFRDDWNGEYCRYVDNYFVLMVVHIDKSERSVHDRQTSSTELRRQTTPRRKGKRRKDDISPAPQSLRPDAPDRSYSDSTGLAKRQRSSSLSSSSSRANQAGPVRGTRP